VRDAVRFWEPLRIAYNLILITVVIAWLVATWPHFRPALTLRSAAAMLVLALCANICYCAAYLVELAAHSFPPLAATPRGRWVVWMAGTLLAVVLANYWIADEVYPYVGSTGHLMESGGCLMIRVAAASAGLKRIGGWDGPDC
jgi:hypothetical protein